MTGACLHRAPQNLENETSEFISRGQPCNLLFKCGQCVQGAGAPPSSCLGRAAFARQCSGNFHVHGSLVRNAGSDSASVQGPELCTSDVHPGHTKAARPRPPRGTAGQRYVCVRTAWTQDVFVREGTILREEHPHGKPHKAGAMGRPTEERTNGAPHARFPKAT